MTYNKCPIPGSYQEVFKFVVRTLIAIVFSSKSVNQLYQWLTRGSIAMILELLTWIQ